MQPFGRPAARAVWRHHGRIALDLAAVRPRPAGGGPSIALRPTTTTTTTTITCLRCAIVSPARFYSSQPPPKDSDRPANPIANLMKSVNAEFSAAANVGSSSHELPSTTESRRSALDKKFSHLMDNLQSQMLNASQKLNEMTGYTGIEAIKAENEALEVALAEAQSRVRSARQAYKSSNTKRATTQREVTTLLARKDTWTPTDLERFTELYRTDHVLEGEVVMAQENLTEAEVDEQKLSQKLSAGILKRYHEEQIWSDRIRRASTWGTWGLMGMNFILFVVLQFVAEPWRRRRLVKGVVEEEKRALEEVRAELALVKEGLDKMAKASEPKKKTTRPASSISTTDAVKQVWQFTISGAWVGTWNEWKELLFDPEKWRPAFEDLYSERKLELRMRDASILVLEGAITGAAIAGSIALMCR